MGIDGGGGRERGEGERVGEKREGKEGEKLGRGRKTSWSPSLSSFSEIVFS